ncbi:putative zinc ribbon protein [Klebsiella michiganensis]
MILRTDWHCSGCGNNYHGERYCVACGTGDLSHMPEEASR